MDDKVIRKAFSQKQIKKCYSQDFSLSYSYSQI